MARRRLHNLRVSDPLGGGAGQVAAWLAASHAQDYAGALWALGLRLQDATATALEQAFNEGAILRTHLLRPTWPVVHLLSIYDEYVSSYKDRTAMGSEKHGELLRALGNALAYIIAIDGWIVGRWRRVTGIHGVTIETNLFARLKPAQ
jgi:hypothetical protein